MILQGIAASNTEAIAEALTKAEIEKQRLEAELELSNENLADADAALSILGVTVDE